MAKIPFFVDENTTTGRHSFFARTKPYQRLSFDEVADSACAGTSIEPEVMKAAVGLYMKKAQELLMMGNRVALGDKFITLVPGVKCSVKDTLNPDGTVKTVAQAKDVKPQKQDAVVGAEVSVVFSDTFRNSVSWQRVDKQGNAIADPDDTTEPVVTDNPEQGGNDNGGSGGDNGGDDLEG